MKKREKGIFFKILLISALTLVLLVVIGQLVIPKEISLSLPGFFDKRVFIPETASPSVSPLPTVSATTIKIDFGDGVKMEGKVIAQTAYGALEIITKEKKISLEVKEYKFGLMVTKIGEKENSSSFAWVYLVNGKPGQIAADRFVVYPGDKIEWKYTKI